MGIPIVRTLPALRSAVAGWKAAGAALRRLG